MATALTWRLDMPYFFCKLIFPRPSLAKDMTSEHAQVMRQHVGYWTNLVGQGSALVFGPVADPGGAWGFVVVQVDSRTDVDDLMVEDPVVKHELGARYEIYQMPNVIMRK